jgi:predicted nucleic acid-binding protein
MKFLVDSNVLLEGALRRQHWQEAADFLGKTPAIDLAVADFSLHAIGFYLIKKTPEVFDAIVQDLVNKRVPVLRLDPSQLTLVTATAKAHRLDFDDAFVYTVAELNGLTIVSFDIDFDRTPRGRRTPAAASSP